MPVIKFRGKIHSVLLKNTLQRHSNRKHIRNTEKHHLVVLTKEGKKQAFELGKKMQKKAKLKLYFSPSIRTRQTAFHLYQGFKQAGGKAAKYKHAKRKGVRKELLGGNMFPDNVYAQKELSKVGGSNSLMMRNWLDGKYPPEKIASPQKMAEDIIRKRFGLGQRAARAGVKGYQMLNITHDWQMMAVFERLTGKKFDKAGLRAPKPNEGIIVYHTKEGKAILEYQGKRFEVTRRLNQILKRNN